MTRRFPILLLAAATAATACGRKGARAADFDSATAAALGPSAGTPVTVTTNGEARAEAFDVGHSLDRMNRLTGGSGGQFSVHDTLMVSITLQNARAGDPVSARIRNGNKTVDSMSVTAPAPDSTHQAIVAMHFVNDKAWPKGHYQVEVFVGAISQGVRDFIISQD